MPLRAISTKRLAAAAAVAVAVAIPLGGCSDGGLPSLPKIGDLNPWKEKQAPLPGKRIPVMAQSEKLPGELAAADKPIVLPPQKANEAWAQPGGEANNAPGHLALSASPRQSWSADAGAGSSKAGRLTATPIVYSGRIFTLDAEGTVSAFGLSGGSAAWRVSMKPEREKAGGLFSLGASGGGGFGGGMAADNGRLYATSGYGNVAAFDPQSGKKLWEKSLGTPVRAAPTAAGDRVFVVSTEGRFYCLSGVDGSELWVVRGLPQQASLVINTSAAVDGDLVVVPYPSGDLVALKVSDGSSVWSESLTRTRATSQLAALSDAARPAIDNGTVFAVGHAGRMIATSARTGERLWSLNVPGTQTPWVAGESVFVVDTGGQLMAVGRRDGKVQWTMNLPGGGTWSGPVLAGGALWLTSSKGQLVGVDAATGRVTSQQDLGNPSYIAPVVAQSRMFVVTDNAKLIALN
jgi:outer membrane protein assembly factor BamB